MAKPMKFLIILTVLFFALKPYDPLLTAALHNKSLSILIPVVVITGIGLIFAAYRPKLSGFIAGAALLALGGLKAYGHIDDLVAPAPLNFYFFGGGVLWLMVAFSGLSQPKANKDAKAKEQPEDQEDPQARLERRILVMLENQNRLYQKQDALASQLVDMAAHLHGHLKRLETQRPSSASDLQRVMQELQALPMFVDGALPGKVAQYREVLEALRQLPREIEGLSPDALRRLGEIITAANNLPDELPEPAKLERAAETATKLVEMQPALAVPTSGESGLNLIRDEFTAGYEEAEEENDNDSDNFEEIYDATITELLRIYPELEAYEGLDLSKVDVILRRKAALWSKEFMRGRWDRDCRSNINDNDEDLWDEILEKLTKLQIVAHNEVKV